MLIKLYIRNAPNERKTCSLRVDFKRESNDSIRTANLGVDIFHQIEDMIHACEEKGLVG